MQRSLIAITRDILVAQNEVEIFNSEEAQLRLQELFAERYQKENGMQYLYGEIEGELTLFSNQLESLKSYVADTYANTNELPKHDVFNPIKVLESSGSVDIVDPLIIPDEFYITVTTQKLDKKAILKKLKEGEEVPGCRLVKKSYVRGIK